MKLPDFNPQTWLHPLERLVKWLTPMTLEGHAFVDCVSGEDVFYFRDAYGKKWLKNSRFGMFKVEAN